MKRCGTIVILLLGLISIAGTSCSSNDEEMTAQQQADGDTSVTVTADGNINALFHRKLSFSSGGKVDEIFVSEGDTVSKGDILVKLDTGALELAEAQAQVALNQARVARTSAELTTVQAQAGVAQAEAGVTQSELALKNAEIVLEQTRTSYSVSDIRVAEAAVDVAQRNFDEALFTYSRYDIGTPGYEDYQKLLLQAEAGLKAAKNTLDAMLTGFDVKEVEAKKLQVEAARQSRELAEQNLEIAELSLSLAEESVEQASQTVSLAQKTLDKTKKDLEEATMVAPFDGTISRVGVKEGEFLSPAAVTASTVIEIIDLKNMELVVRVDELDIAKVKTGQRVMISVDALPEVKLEGQVTYISPVASEPAGVVLFEDEDEVEKYEVKIDFGIPNNPLIRSGMSATAEIIVE